MYSERMNMFWRGHPSNLMTEQSKAETSPPLLVPLTTILISFSPSALQQHQPQHKNIQQRRYRAQVSKQTSFYIPVFQNFQLSLPSSEWGTSNSRTDCHAWVYDGGGNMQYRRVVPFSFILQLHCCLSLWQMSPSHFLEGRKTSLSS